MSFPLDRWIAQTSVIVVATVLLVKNASAVWAGWVMALTPTPATLAVDHHPMTFITNSTKNLSYLRYFIVAHRPPPQEGEKRVMGQPSLGPTD